MKVTVLLRHNHEVLRGLIEKVGKTAGKLNEKAIVQEMRSQVQMHSQMASSVFFPALVASPSERAAQLVATAQKRCAALENLLQELSRMNSSDSNFEIKLNTVISEIGRQIDMEEDEIFHEARKTFPESRLEQLGLETQSRRNSLKMIATV